MQIKDQRSPRGRMEPGAQRPAPAVSSPWPVNEQGSGWSNGFLFERQSRPRRKPQPMRAVDQGPCPIDGKPIIAAHSYAKYCSATCRQRARRARAA